MVVDRYSIENNNNYEETNDTFYYLFIKNILIKYLNKVDYERIKNNYEIYLDKTKKNSLEWQFNCFSQTFKELNKIIKNTDELDWCMDYTIQGDFKHYTCFKPAHYILEYQIFCSYIFVYYVIFLQQVKVLIGNKELMTILTNIKKQNNDKDKILEEFYLIYISYYSDVFENKLTKRQMKVLILAVENRQMIKVFEKNDYYKKEIDEFKEDKDFDKLINSINSSIFIKYHSIGDYYVDYYITKDKDYYYNRLFDYIMIKVINYIDNDKFLDITFKKDIYVEKLKKNSELEETLKKKNKYLFGEEKESVEKLDINKVSTGYEFEDFLKELFIRLGYNVVLTKSSRDQGADLIVEKDLIKIVVQAKFYSNTVGNKAIQEVIASKSYYNADSCMVITNNYFTSSAYELAKANNVKLVDGTELSKMIQIANIYI